MTRIHIVLPPYRQPRPPVALPDFVTDIRPPDPGPWPALARAADLAGLAGVIVPFDPQGPESLVTAAGLLRTTRHVEVSAGLRPWIATPQYTAKLSASLQRFSGGRLGWYFEDGNAETEQFVTTAEEFWQRPDGLPEVLSEHAFPLVLFADSASCIRLDLRALSLEAKVTAIEAHAQAGVSDFFLDVGDDPGEVYRLGEYVLPLLSFEREPNYVG
ncbi:LLM class flavin-dependent oxidoreductase [Actinospica robiniae]|uniref:LLM class flavin-dependent oxidoreductase n=1 Tax=Actinospica robiniae TaxID=304901 RepID=UPI00042A80FB|nr:LLM class flavin-dependent oxidoreductase [Actinospica robiniae]